MCMMMWHICVWWCDICVPIGVRHHKIHDAYSRHMCMMMWHMCVWGCDICVSQLASATIKSMIPTVDTYVYDDVTYVCNTSYTTSPHQPHHHTPHHLINHIIILLHIHHITSSTTSSYLMHADTHAYRHRHQPSNSSSQVTDTKKEKKKKIPSSSSSGMPSMMESTTIDTCGREWRKTEIDRWIREKQK